MQEKSETRVVSRKLTTEAIDLVEKVVNLLKERKKKKGDYTRVLSQDITSECIVIGAKILIEKIENQS